jgi:hypothetical protein
VARKKGKRKKPSPDVSQEIISKEDVIGWRGGLPLDFERKMESEKTLREELSIHVSEVLEQEITNQEERISNISEWLRQYKGERDERNFPFEKSANTAIPITRSGSDTVYVRLEDTLYGRKKIFLLKPVIDGIDDLVFEMEKGLQWYMENKLDFKRVMRDPLMQAVKIGTSPVKVDWVEENKVNIRYATEEEMETLDPDELYDLPNTKTKGVKEVISTYKGPKVFGLRREDWVMSSDAVDPEDAYICGFKGYYRKAQMELKVRQDLWEEDEVKAIIHPDEYDEVKKDRAELQGKEITKTEYEYPFEIWELWTKFDCDEDGEEDDIVLFFHRASKKFVRGIYNPIFSNFRPFELVKGFPVEFSGDGEGVCEILYKLQVEIDTLHNQRIDRMTEMNAPMVFVRRGAGLDTYKINPGHVEVVDEDLQASIRIEHFQSGYFSTEREEDRCLDYSYKAIGIAPENIGVTSAERPVFKEAMARLQEANKKFQSLRDNVIQSYQRIGKKLIEYFGQYEPSYKYQERVEQEDGQIRFEEKTISFPLDAIWTGMKVELEAANQLMNVDLRREINMTVYQMMTDYMTNSAGIVQAILNEQVPSEFKKWLSASYEIGVTIMRRILEDFDQQDAESLAFALDKIIDIDAAIQSSYDLMPPELPEGGNGGAGGPLPVPQGGQIPPQGPPPGVAFPTA